ncbi:MAG: hypothetical protein V8Q84_05325 [Bilophila sp.]
MKGTEHDHDLPRTLRRPLEHRAPDRMPAYPLVNSVSRQALGISYEEWTKDVDKCAEATTRTTDEAGPRLPVHSG